MRNSIETIDVGVRINGTSYPPNSFIIHENERQNKVTIRVLGAGSSFSLRVPDTDIDGVQSGSSSEIGSFLREKGFINGGGGTGEGVPTGTALDVLTWDENGNPIASRINAWQLTDIGGRPSFPFGVLAGASLQDDNPLLLFREATQEAKSGAFPVYRTGARLSVGDPTDNDDAVPLAQMDARVPLLGTNDFLVNRGSGNVSGKIIGSDILPPAGSTRVVTINASGEFQSYTLASAATAGTLVLRSSAGRVKGGTATENDDLTTLAQINARLPAPPATGTFTLRSVDGVVSWVTE